MAATAGARAGRSREPGALSWSPRVVAGVHCCRRGRGGWAWTGVRRLLSTRPAPRFHSPVDSKWLEKRSREGAHCQLPAAARPGRGGAGSLHSMSSTWAAGPWAQGASAGAASDTEPELDLGAAVCGRGAHGPPGPRHHCQCWCPESASAAGTVQRRAVAATPLPHVAVVRCSGPPRSLPPWCYPTLPPAQSRLCPGWGVRALVGSMAVLGPGPGRLLLPSKRLPVPAAPGAPGAPAALQGGA